MNRWVLPTLALLGLSLSASASGSVTTYPVAPFAGAVVSADFNGDGRTDVATACGDSVSVLLGNGDGTFQPAVNSATPYPGWTASLAVGDFDQDGDPDLVTSWYVLLGRGDGTFASASWALGWAFVAVGDMNSDGKADLVGITDYGCSDYCSGVLAVQLGNGDGTFASPWRSPYFDWAWTTGPVALGDFDGDRNLDVITTAGLQRGNGDGTLGIPPLDGWSQGSSGVADFNGDGYLDVAGDWFTQLGNGDGTFQSPVAVTVGVIGRPALADYDGDGKADLAVTSGYGVEILLGNGDGTLRHAGRFDYDPTYSATGFLAAADFDGDGLPDLAATVEGGNGSGVTIFLNGGNLEVPSMAISDATVTEGHSGTRAVTFTVSLSATYSQAVTVAYGTADGAAAAPGDYVAASGTLTIDAGQTSGTITVLVKGDRLPEAPETFVVNLDHATHAFLLDAQGVATVVDDEPLVAVASGVRKAEGRKRQTTSFPFVITLSNAYDQAVSVSYRTVDGTANSSDYVARTGSLMFNPGETTKTIAIDVMGDDKREPDETFRLKLYGPSGNAALSFGSGTGTILNDD